MKAFSFLAFLFCLLAGAQAQETVLPAQVLSLASGVIKNDHLGYHSGGLPWRSAGKTFAPGEWASGTSILLQVEIPSGYLLNPQGCRLLSFVDDTGKNLAEPTREGPGFGRDKPLEFAVNDTGTEALVSVRSSECPNKGANKISGEVELVLLAAETETAESKPIPARVGSKVAVGPVEIEITKFSHGETQEIPDGLPTPPSGDQNELGIQIHPRTPDTVVIKVEVLSGLNKAVIREISGIPPDGKHATYLSLVSPSLASVMFRTTYATGKSKTSGFVRFSTGLGIYEE